MEVLEKGKRGKKKSTSTKGGSEEEKKEDEDEVRVSQLFSSLKVTCS